MVAREVNVTLAMFLFLSLSLSLQTWSVEQATCLFSLLRRESCARAPSQSVSSFTRHVHVVRFDSIPKSTVVCTKVSLVSTRVSLVPFELNPSRVDITALTSFSHHYDTLPPSPVRSSVEPSSQPPFYISLDSSPASPSFQRRFPMAFVAMLGFIELSAGLLVLTLELLVFDVSIGVWCGGIYALAGAAALVLGR